jgi:MraZ protein
LPHNRFGSRWAKKGQPGVKFNRKASSADKIVAENPENRVGASPDSSQGAAAAGSGSGNEPEVEFYGNPRAKLDDRGRLKMPAEFKAAIEAAFGENFNEFYITSREGLDAEIFTMPAWRKQWAKIMKISPSNPVRRDLVARYSFYGAKADMDPQGRLLLPEELRNAGLINQDVTITGEGNLLRVTAVSRLAEQVQNKPMSPQNMDALAEFGL